MSGLAVSLAQDGPIPLAANFSCARGEMLALVGPSGSGKSTILRSIAGLYRPRQGSVTVNGAPWLDTEGGVSLPPHRRRVGMVFQNYGLFPHMTALENVATAVEQKGARQPRQRAGELLELVHLGGLEQRRPSQLSGGQQQRVAVARALARDPDVLLLDEPFSAVDRATRERLYREVAALRQALSMPTILVTHDIDEGAMLADRICVLHRGRTLQTGNPQELMARPVSAEVARLIGIRNVFGAVVREQQPEREATLVEWAGVTLTAAYVPGLRAGQPATCIIPDGFVVLHRRDRPSRGEHENPVSGRIESLLALGQTAQLALRPHAAAQAIFFSVPLHVARRNGIETGVEATVSLLQQGLHVLGETRSADEQ
jgi:molybdate transport system ATP-binding protein